MKRTEQIQNFEQISEAKQSKAKRTTVKKSFTSDMEKVFAFFSWLKNDVE